MTIFEYAIAREANRLMEEGKTRELTEEEWDLLRVLEPTVMRIAREERTNAGGSVRAASPL